MNIKSYVRGIGGGLIVASLVLGFGVPKEKMTDAEIKKRASELGMVESSILSSLSVSEDSSSVSEEVTSNQDTSGEVSEESDTSAEDTEVSVDSTDTTEVSEEQPPVKEPDEETVTPEDLLESNTPSHINPLGEDETGFVSLEEGVEIQIVRGDSSVTVSRRMFEAGLIESAVEFDKFLCSEGYDKSISVGVHNIPYGLSFEEMAQIITGRK